MADDIEKKIIEQLEYYFGDINLPRDKFMQRKIKEDDGWIPIEVLLTFRRLASLSKDSEFIANAIEKSENKLISVSEDRKKLRRTPDQPAPENNEEHRKQLMSRTAYVKGFRLNDEIDNIITFLDPFGPIDSCAKRTYLDKATKQHKFKGSCFIIFKNNESCKKFIEQESVKFNDTELIRKWQSDYIEEKRKEFQDRKNKKNKLAVEVDEKKGDKEIKFPNGAILHISGIKEDQTLTREEIKEKIKDIADIEPSYVDFNKGDVEGYIRMPSENSAVNLCAKLEDGNLEIGDIKVLLRVLEGEEEQEYHKKALEVINKRRQSHKKQGGGRYKNNRKRKNNFQDEGPKSKIKN